MKILAIETSIPQGSLSVHQADARLLGRELPDSQRTAKCLVPEVKRLLADCQLHPNDIDLVAVSCGPGSFTGLRIGVTFAKTFAYGTGAKILGVPTADAIALRAHNSLDPDFGSAQLQVVIDAQRRQIYCQSYTLKCDRMPHSVEPFRIVSRTVWVESKEHDNLLAGPGLEQVFGGLKDDASSHIRDRLHARCLDQSVWHPKADEIGMLAWHRRHEASEELIWELLPEYGRRSAAEEKAEAKTR